MITVILSGHGGFATGLEKAIRQIIGEQQQFRAIDFPVEMTTEQLELAMKQAISDLDSGDGIVFLTDLLGGTPFRTASLLSQQRNDIEVLREPICRWWQKCCWNGTNLTPLSSGIWQWNAATGGLLVLPPS